MIHKTRHSRRFAFQRVLSLLIGLCEISFAQWIDLKTYTMPTVNGQPQDITAGPDGALWFTEQIGNKIGRITTAGVVTEFPIPSNCGFSCYPAGIAAGPDGAVWFVERAGNRIGRITTAGAITEFPLPNPGFLTQAFQITAGPDGALWFTEVAGRIGRISTAGAITEFPLPLGSAPQYITTGPDSALWFTNSVGTIGRITTAGAVTGFPVPGGRVPFSITKGPDGALWFTETNNGRVGRITTAGAFTEHDVGLVLSPRAIAAGPDGALWFTGGILGFPPVIARITTAGVLTAYPVPAAGPLPVGITAGPDGALWAGNVGNKISRVPACGLGLRASFAAATLTLNFALGMTAPTTWATGYYSGAGLTGLWSASIPAVVPPLPFSVPVPFSSVGNVGVVSVLKDPATQEFRCAEWQIIDTGGVGPPPEAIERGLLESLPKR